MALSTTLLLALLPLARAIPGAVPTWIGPMPTPEGLIDTDGISPLPTPAPGWDAIPLELRRRQNTQIPFPPPDNWCGFVDGDPNDPLSCSADLTCINSGAAFGCCTATTGFCDALYTTCYNFGDSCDAECEADSGIRKCSDSSFPYCGTYAFPGGSHLYNCQMTTMVAANVEFLNSYYATAIGSTIGAQTTDPVTQASASSTGGNGGVSTGGTGSGNGGGNDGSGLSPAAIDGIAVGAAVVGAAIFGVIVFFLVRYRKRRRWAAIQNQQAGQPGAGLGMTPLQQQHQSLLPDQTAYAIPGKGFSGYQVVPQNDAPLDNKHNGSPTPQTNSQYLPPPGTPGSQPPTTSGNNIPSVYAPSTLSAGHGETAPPSVFSGSLDPRHSYYRPPTSTNVQEVDGTLGNPGVLGTNRPQEVDSTMGNPGVPLEGSRVPQIQGLPGGSPSSTEIEGRSLQGTMAPALHVQGPGETATGGGSGGMYNMGSSLNTPWSNSGPYEMGEGDHR